MHGIRIQLQACAKSFNHQRVLEPLDLDIEAGETLVLLGPSGCGKTTTLRLIAGLEFPDRGTVRFDGKDVTGVPIEARNVGMVFQSYALFPNMTVADNIGYGLRVRGLGRAEVTQRVGDMLRMMRIEALADRRIDQLSGGQKQRVALARAIAPRPRVLLLDEPLTALDARLRDALRAEINALLRGLGITAVYVTHDQAEAMALGDRIAVMDKGRIAQIGTPREIYFHPANEFVAEFIGTMNTVGDVRFRPEDARVVDRGLGTFDGTVISATFLGDHVRAVVKLHAGEELTLHVRPRDTLSPGEVVGIKLMHRIEPAAEVTAC